MFCMNCGSKVSESATFCDRCGKELVKLPTAGADTRIKEKAGDQAKADSPYPKTATDQAKPATKSRAYAPAHSTTTTNQTAAFANGDAPQPDSSPTVNTVPLQNIQYTEDDIKWTTKQILTGKPMEVFTLAFGFWVALFAIALIEQLGSTQDVSDDALRLFYMAVDFVIAKNNADFAGYIIVLLPFVTYLTALTWFPALFIVKYFSNRRLKGIAPSSEAVAAHKEAARFKWRLSYSILVGVFDFMGSYMILYCIAGFASSLIPGGFNYNSSIFGFLAPLIAITVAEIRIRKLTRYLIGSRTKNSEFAAQIRQGKHLENIPDEYADEISVAKIARLVELGISGTPTAAVRWLKVIRIRSRIMQNASFLGSALTAIATFVTFGLFSIAINETSNVTAAFAKGTYDPVTGKLAEGETRAINKPKPYFEIICLVIAIIVGFYLIYQLGTAVGILDQNGTGRKTACTARSRGSSQ